jgi:hypothetical protein
MKRLFVIAWLCLAGMTCFAQVGTLDSDMNRFRNICMKVREAMATRNADMLGNYADSLNGDVKGGISIADFDRFTVVDGSKEVSLKGHLQFKSEFLDSLVVFGCDLTAIPADAPTVLRAAPFTCKMINRALAAHGRGVYSTKGSGCRELVAVAENGGHLNFYVNDKKNGKQYKVATPKGSASAWICWTMDSFGEYEITVENTGDKPISFVIASN